MDRKPGAWIAMSVLVLAGCTPAGDSAGPSLEDEACALVEEVLEAEPSYDPAYHEQGLEFQLPILADCVVTFAEYEQAVLAEVDCVRREGFEIEGPSSYPEGGMVVYPGGDPRLFLYTWAVNVHDDEAFDDVSARCDAQWSYWVKAVWSAQHAPTESEVQAWLERAWECAAEQGFPISDPPTLDDAANAVFPGSGCEPWLP